MAPYSWGPSTGTQIAEAAVEAGPANAERTARTAQSNALTEAARAQQQETAMKVLGNHERLIQARPDLAENPMMRSALNVAFGKIGMPVPLDASGHVDVKALRSMVSPQKQFDEMTGQEKAAELALPPEMRGQHPGAPETFGTAPARAAMTPAAEQQIYTSIAATAKLVGEGHEKPAMLLAAVQAAKQRLAAHGMDTSGADQYLNADGTGLSEVLREQLVGQMTETKVDQIKRLTGVSEVNAATRAKIAERAAKHMDTTEAQGNVRLQQGQTRIDQSAQRLTLSQRREQAQEQNWASLAATRAANVSQGWERIKGTEEYRKIVAGQAVNRMGLAVLSKRFGAVNGEYQSARTQLEANRRAIANGAVDDDLVNNTTELQRIVDTLAPEVEALGHQLTQQPAVNLQMTTGQKSTVTNDGHPKFDTSKATRTGQMGGRKVYQMPDGHVYDEQGARVPGTP